MQAGGEGGRRVAMHCWWGKQIFELPSCRVVVLSCDDGGSHWEGAADEKEGQGKKKIFLCHSHHSTTCWHPYSIAKRSATWARIKVMSDVVVESGWIQWNPWIIVLGRLASDTGINTVL